MISRVRVFALAKELLITSKDVIDYLVEAGEFVKSASSTIERPVADRVRRHFRGGADPQPRAAAAVDVRPAPRRTDYVQLHLRGMVSAIQGALSGNEWPPQPYSAKDWNDLLGSISALAFALTDAVRRLQLIEATPGGVGITQSFPLQNEIAAELLSLARRTRVE